MSEDKKAVYWTPDPATILRLYKEMEEGPGWLELDWKCPGRRAPSPQKEEVTDPVDNEETPEEEKDDGFDFEDDSPAPTIDDDAVLESEDTYECLSSTEVDHLEKEDQEMEHEKF